MALSERSTKSPIYLPDEGQTNLTFYALLSMIQWHHRQYWASISSSKGQSCVFSFEMYII
jgi:hypothetical protein